MNWEPDLLTNEPAGSVSSLPTVVLAHGAGAPMNSAFMETMATGLAGRGVRVVRFEFPYMQERRESGRRRGPNPAAKLCESWLTVIERLGPPEKLVIGGKSMGGRIASMVADEAGVAGLVCMGYPFHPPGRPDKLRTDHLAALATPALILQGTRDAFGTPDEIESYTLSPKIRVAYLESGDHSFKPLKRSGRTLSQNLEEALEAIRAFVAEVS
jgi:predicted alpha/beta-hydrolase family hydrolase